MTIKENYYCEIKKGNSPCKIIKFKKSNNYYNTLIKKLDWKGDLSQKKFQKLNGPRDRKKISYKK